MWNIKPTEQQSQEMLVFTIRIDKDILIEHIQTPDDSWHPETALQWIHQLPHADFQNIKPQQY